MGIVLSTNSISLDGFMAQPDGMPGPLHDWLWAGEHPSRHAESMKLSEPSREWFDSGADRVGAIVVGRKTYDNSGGWGGRLPFDWPFFVVTRRRDAWSRIFSITRASPRRVRPVAARSVSIASINAHEADFGRAKLVHRADVRRHYRVCNLGGARR